MSRAAVMDSSNSMVSQYCLLQLVEDQSAAFWHGYDFHRINPLKENPSCSKISQSWALMIPGQVRSLLSILNIYIYIYVYHLHYSYICIYIYMSNSMIHDTPKYIYIYI